MLLSIGIMMKNEEEHIEKCLKGLMPILEEIDSEIVVVDTGSTDNSVQIAKKYTNKVYSYNWNNNFADMRNKIISHCEGEWYLSVDADEVLLNAEDLIEFFLQKKHEVFNAATVKIKSFFDKKKNNYNIANLTRLFKNDSDFKFVNSIHEQPIYKFPVAVLNSVFDHYGYLSDDNELMERKFKRNKELLEKEIENDPNNLYMKFQLAVTYLMYKQSKQAFDLLDETYKTMNKVEKDTYKQIGILYSNLLSEYKKINECKAVCKYYLNLSDNEEQYKIDFLYNLGQIYFMEEDYSNAIINYKLYLNLLNKYENNELVVDVATVPYRGNYKEYVYAQIAKSNFMLNNYRESIDYGLKLNKKKNEINMLLCMNEIVKSFIELELYDELNGYYLDVLDNFSEVVNSDFINIIENEKNKADKKKRDRIIDVFSKNSNFYGVYNQFISNPDDESKLVELIKLIGLMDSEKNNLGCLGEILYIALEKKYDIKNIFTLRYKTIYEFIEFCNEKYGDKILDLFKQYIEEYNSETFEEIKINMSFCKSILILKNKKRKYDNEIFNKYIEYGIKYIRIVYSDFIINNELVNEMLNEEHRFMLYMSLAEKFNNIDRKQSIRYLKKALIEYPCMKDGIAEMLDKIKEKFNKKSEMDLLKDKFVENISILIDNNKLYEAKELIEQIKIIVGYDKRINELEEKINLISSI